MILTPKPGAHLPIVELDRPVSVMRVDEKDGGVHRVHGRPFVRERADGRTHRVGSGGFWQVHPKAADTLVTAVMQGSSKGESVLPHGITEVDLVVLDPPRAGAGARRWSTWRRWGLGGSRMWLATRRRWPGTSRLPGRGSGCGCCGCWICFR
ncbi:hypothetical protein SGLAM104S_06780 [Streptomyces glaucescens]